jgi:hypothetical protein
MTNVNGLQKLKCKKEFGVWFYKKIKPDCYNDLDGPIYELYDVNGKFVDEFGCYGDMKYFIETGIII